MKIITSTIASCIMLSGAVQADLTQFEFTSDYITSISSTDGIGNFTYSFSKGTNALSYDFYAQDIVLEMNSSIVTDIITPSGWNTQLDQGIVHFSWTNGSPIAALSETPFVFKVKTSHTESSLNADGIATFSSPGGYSKFDYIQPIPEPSTISFLAIASFGIYLFRKKLSI